MNRLADLSHFYEILADLERRLGGTRKLSECDSKLGWPLRGVYFFFEPGEIRSDSGQGARIVRVGTHAVSAGSKAKLWQRLAQHRGNRNGAGGNHRGSIFRLLVGAAIVASRGNLHLPTWGHGQNAPRDVREQEQELEVEVSRYIGAMPLLWLDADDDPAPTSIRAYFESNSIALLSNARPNETPLDAPSYCWLGRSCPQPKVLASGLWNSRCVDASYDPAFLPLLRRRVASL